MLLTRALALLLFLADMTLPENIEIARFLQQNKRDKWRVGIDAFTLSESECSQTENQYLNCTNLCEAEERAGSRHFRCSCSDSSPTLTYNNSQWTCQEKGRVRSQVGCGIRILFKGEKEKERLRLLNTIRRRRTELDHKSCSVNLNNSWYIGCYGEKVPLKETTKVFRLEWGKAGPNFAYFLKVLNDSSLRGRIINLGINCTADNYKAGCLLFKLEGTLSCPIRKPLLHGFQSSTVPTASNSSTLKTTSLMSKARLDSTATPASRRTTPTKPSTGLINEKQKHDDTSSFSSLGLIAGVSSCTATVVLVIAVVLLYRRRKSRKGVHASTSKEFKKTTSDGNSEKNVAFQPDAQNDYLPNRKKEPCNSHIGEVYAALDVPEGHNIYGTGNVDEPFYSFLQDPEQDKEEGQRYSCLSLDPALYHTLEKLQVMDQRNAEYNCPTEPMYNVLEGPNPGVRKETESCGPISVNEPSYNTVEKPVSNEGLSRGNYDPVYNILEDPLYLGFGGGGQNGHTGLQDPVYNVLEGPGADVVECKVSKDDTVAV